jgi:phosphoribosylanthranilate isomerase
MLVKICGLTDANAASLCALKGANYIGIIFSSVSPRHVSIEKAQEIAAAAHKLGAKVVGVFVDETLEQIDAITSEVEVDILQLHGSQSRSYVAHLASKYQLIYVIGKNKLQYEEDSPLSAELTTLPENLTPLRGFLLFDNVDPAPYIAKYPEFKYFIAGNITIENVLNKVASFNPTGIDVSSALESSVAVKDIKKVEAFMQTINPKRYGQFGGQYVPELLMSPLKELEQAYLTIAKSQEFCDEFVEYLTNYVGRPTALTEVKNFAKSITDKNIRVFLKREDLLHTGAHKINNAIGQCLLAKKMGKTRIVAETGAGQHGLATATACAMFGLPCTVYMGAVDVERQAPNVAKMRLLGAKVVAVEHGGATLKDAVNEALRDWGESYDTTHYCLGSALGPYPFPQMVADFQSIIGREAKEQFYKRLGAHPSLVVACVGGGSNAIGMFGAYLEDMQVKLVGVEAGGSGSGLGNNAARFQEGSPGILHGSYTYLLQTKSGQVVDTYSISAGLDYPAVGPQHSDLFSKGRANYTSVTDSEALDAFLRLTKTEGIIPALESSHALAYVMQIVNTLEDGSNILVNLSGRGDKDLPQLLSKELSHVVHN